MYIVCEQHIRTVNNESVTRKTKPKTKKLKEQDDLRKSSLPSKNNKKIEEEHLSILQVELNIAKN
jgi:hypothetical protein